MDGRKILEVIGIYRKHFTEKGIKVFVFPEGMQINSDSIIETIGTRRAYFEKKGIRISDFPPEKIPTSKEEILAHCHGMLGKMEGFLREGRIEKTFRWLGFIVGCLWSVEQYSGLKVEKLAYCHGALDKIEGFVKEDRLDQAFVWPGFVQGCLWATGEYSIQDLQNHSRPAEGKEG